MRCRARTRICTIDTGVYEGVIVFIIIAFELHVKYEDSGSSYILVLMLDIMCNHVAIA